MSSMGDDMGFFWPTSTYAEPDGFVRVGRFLHWTATLIVACIGVGAAYGFKMTDVADRSWWWWILAPMTVIYLVGRGARYMIGGE
jgi:hypothetical protein